MAYTKGDYAAAVMKHMMDHAAHGYTQGNRWGNGKSETITVLGKQFTIAGGDRDCSSGVISAWEAVGVDCGGATYTGNMRSCMTRSGNFEWHPGTSFIASPGDIYLNEGSHTAMCLTQTPDTLMEFNIAETGGIYGVEGDQTGHESHTRSYYNFPWNGILHYIGEGKASASTPPTPAIPKPYLAYKASLDEGGSLWLPEMRDFTSTDGDPDDFAGDGVSPIRWLALDMPGWYQAKSQDDGWLEPVRGYDVRDLLNGCAGDGSPITAIRCYYETQDPAKTGWLAIEYQVQLATGEWLPIMHDLTDTGGSSDDFAGDGSTPIVAFRAQLVVE